MTMAASGSRSSSTLIAILAEVKRLRALLFCFACARDYLLRLSRRDVSHVVMPVANSDFVVSLGQENLQCSQLDDKTHTDARIIPFSMHSSPSRRSARKIVLVHRTPWTVHQQPIRFYCISNAPAAHENGAIHRTRNGQWSTF